MTTTFVLDGVTIDLTREQIDVYGARWTWTGLENETGVPLMQSGTDTPLPLDEVYATYGPLIPAPRATSNALARTVLRASYAGDDVLRPPLPVRPVLRSPAATAPTEEPKPAEPTTVVAVAPSPSTFARFLARIRGGAR